MQVYHLDIHKGIIWVKFILQVAQHIVNILHAVCMS